MRPVLLILILVLCPPFLAPAGNWPQWRGPAGTGVAAPGDYPVHFSNTENIRWKVRLPGAGSSTPAVWDAHIFVTGPDGGRDTVLCFDRDGKERWRTALGPLSEAKHNAGTSANPSPVTDGRRLYAYFRSGAVAALDFDGRVVWQDNLQERYGANTLLWDLGTSPVLTRDHLVIAVMQSGDAYLVAFDKATGKVAWKQPRPFDCAKESADAYTTPTVLTQAGGQRILCWGADHLSSHDALTGQMIWTCGGFNPERKERWRVISSQAVWEDVAVVAYARGKQLAGIDIREETPEGERWLWKREDIGCDVTTPAVRDGRAYVLKENGRMACINLRTGEDVWSTKLPEEHNVFYASPVLAGDLMYCASFNGVVSVGRIGDTFTLLATNPLHDQMTATPVPLDGELLLRGFEHLYCVAGPRPER